MLVNLDASNTVHICLIVTWAVSLCRSAGQSRNHCGHETIAVLRNLPRNFLRKKGIRAL